ncbi:myristoyl transferase [Devosia limi DSM 17137]|uniref:Thiamine pyrimidine synthase n=1 Tax=Devosia limi DSM 17137 TaxID=1121477 RepID=A0A0F5LY00_9HYPH|nr:ABC transporter substrate-binding protein [Devosia limi]KKB86512.1 myristoyl transferase [Devosia limi DSM 17137]SHE86026.1 ABC-type nitrate/sulfonate/bicarbonate transport system, substrate-binding protein [Devosia limi DSM 17137]
MRHLLVAALATLMVSPALAQTEPVTISLDWTPNTNHIGLYVAQAKGFYTDAGLAVEVLPYSDTSAGTLVANHVADFGILGSLGLFTQRTAGADLVATYALMQTETGRLVFNADRADIESPKDLDGLTYGGFGSAWENALIGTIIRHDGGEGSFETVTLGTSAYEALANGAVDFTLEVYTWEGVKAELEGKGQRAFRYADFGVPDQHTNFIGSSQAYLDANPQTAAAFIAASKRGYAYAVANPDEAADILIAANSDVLTDRALIRASLQALIDGHYLQSADGVIGTIDPAKMDAIADYLFTAGILRDGNGNPVATRPDIAAYYTNAFQGGAQ